MNESFSSIFLIELTVWLYTGSTNKTCLAKIDNLQSVSRIWTFFNYFNYWNLVMVFNFIFEQNFDAAPAASIKNLKSGQKWIEKNQFGLLGCQNLLWRPGCRPSWSLGGVWTKRCYNLPQNVTEDQFVLYLTPLSASFTYLQSVSQI